MKHLDEETARAMSEFASIEEQLNAVEKYAMYFLEEETAEFAAEQLRLAEVLTFLGVVERESGLCRKFVIWYSILGLSACPESV